MLFVFTGPFRIKYSIDIVEFRFNIAPMSKPAAIRKAAETDWLALVAEQVGQLRYGVVQITVHDSRVVQIERTEKVRLDKLASATTPAGLES
jgi:hypothetical protein